VLRGLSEICAALHEVEGRHLCVVVAEILAERRVVDVRCHLLIFPVVMGTAFTVSPRPTRNVVTMTSKVIGGRWSMWPCSSEIGSPVTAQTTVPAASLWSAKKLSRALKRSKCTTRRNACDTSCLRDGGRWVMQWR